MSLEPVRAPRDASRPRAACSSSVNANSALMRYAALLVEPAAPRCEPEAGNIPRKVERAPALSSRVDVPLPSANVQPALVDESAGAQPNDPCAELQEAPPLHQDAGVQTTGPAVVVQAADPTFEEKLDALRLSRAEPPADTSVTSKADNVDLPPPHAHEQEREARLTALKKELAEAHQAARSRDEELNAALTALHKLRQQVTSRETECTHWRAEAARAVGQLEAMSAHVEQQNDRIQAVEREASMLQAELAGLRAGHHGEKTEPRAACVLAAD
jgi:hypothetical protein